MEDAQEEDIPTSEESGQGPEPAPVHHFLYEDSSDDSFKTFDTQFAISCFFEDLHDMQGLVRETWQQHKDGVLDDMTAAAVTNAAIEIAQKDEMDLVERS